MLPILFQIGPLKIYTMGLFLVLALFWGSFLLFKTIKLTSNKEEEVFDSLFVSLIGAIFFARLGYVVFNFQDFGFSFLRFILINGYPGLWLWGGILGGIITFFIYCRIYRHKFARIFDHAVPALFLALAFGKIGVFFAGSEVGTPTNFFLSVVYRGFEGTRHISPIYEALIYFVSVFISYRILMAIRRERFFDGFNFVFFIIIFSLANILLDFFRIDNIYFAGKSINLILSIIALSASCGFIAIKYKSEILSSFDILRSKFFHGKRIVKKNKGSAGKKSS